ncbi:hypothetical protein Tco_0501070, partial [Tanacetum coccineum]
MALAVATTPTMAATAVARREWKVVVLARAVAVAVVDSGSVGVMSAVEAPFPEPLTPPPLLVVVGGGVPVAVVP